MMFGMSRIPMGYSSISSLKEIFLFIQVVHYAKKVICKRINVFAHVFILPDYHRHQRDPDKFFITDLAIITISNDGFTFTNRIIPVCLAYNSHTGYDLRYLGYKISGKDN